MKKVLIAGGSGLIGQKLTKILLSKGYQVGILSRKKRQSDDVKYHQWDLNNQSIDDAVLDYDYVVNLTGAGIADKNWTQKRKNIIIESRVKSAQLLLKAFSKKKKVKAVINASAIGYYGDSGEVLVDESSPIQTDEFLSQVCKLWEKAAYTLSDFTERLVIVRIGTVLSDRGGALDKIVPPIKLGMANYLGSGKQWMSWIHLDDIARMIVHFIEEERIEGVYNGVSPNPERNIDFTKTIKSVINRFAIVLPAPSIGIKAVFGEMSRLVLNSNKVSSQKVQNTGFHFQFGDLEKALTDLFN